MTISNWPSPSCLLFRIGLLFQQWMLNCREKGNSTPFKIRCSQAQLGVSHWCSSKLVRIANQTVLLCKQKLTQCILTFGCTRTNLNFSEKTVLKKPVRRVAAWASYFQWSILTITFFNVNFLRGWWYARKGWVHFFGFFSKAKKKTLSHVIQWHCALR